MLRLILGPARSGKTTLVMNEIKERCSSGGNGLYLLVPDQYSHTAERLLCAECGNSISLCGEVLTFGILASRIIGETGAADMNTVNNAGRMILMSRALQTALPDLHVFCRRTGNAAFVKKLVETASEIKNACLEPDDLRQTALRADNPLSDKLCDLASILEIYWSLFGASQLDSDDLLIKAAERADKCSFLSGATVWIDGFADFSVRQMEMIKSMLLAGTEITVCLTCDSLSGYSDIFEITRTTAAQLIAIANRTGTDVKTLTCNRDAEATGSFEVLESILSGEEIHDIPVDNAISVVRASNPTEECEYAASTVLELVRNCYKWQDISVVCGTMDQYRSAGRSIFAKYGVPIYMNEKTDVLMLPPVALISSALKTIVTGWEYSNIFRYLKTGIPDISRDECDDLENYVLQWSIRGSSWYTDEPWTLSLSGFQETECETPEPELEKLNDIRRRAVGPLLKLQNKLKSADIVRDKLSAIYDFLEDIRLPEKIMKTADEYETAGNHQMSATYLQIWDTIVDAMDQFYRAAGDINYDLAEFISLWELALLQYDIGTIPPAIDTVSFGDFERVRNKGTKCLIVLGATEDAVPKMSISPGVFSDYERDILIGSGLALRISSSARVSGDLYSAYSALMLPSDKLIMCWPVSDLNGSEKRPTPILGQLCDALHIEPIYADPSVFRLSAETPCVEEALLKPDSAAALICETDRKMYDSLSVYKNAVALTRGNMKPEIARSLYGSDVSLSASRIERFYSCRYQFFLNCGLKVKPRAKAELNPIEIGLFMHKVLQNTTDEIKGLGGFKAVSDETCAKITRRHVKDYIDSVLYNAVERSGKIRYLVDRIASDAVQIVLEMASEFRRSDFKPLDFELSISESGELYSPEDPLGGSRLRTYGIVDRVDGWLHNGKLYLRVVDYKTGRKSFSLTDVWNGIGIQMLIYLFALERSGNKYYEHEIVPSGVLYVPARDAIISVSRNASDPDIMKERAKQIKRSGLILADDEVIEAMENGSDKRYLPVKLSKDGSVSGDALVSLEKLGKLSAHIDKLMKKAAREILSGKLMADPYCKGQTDVCSFCDYRQVCAFGDYEGDKPRYIKNRKAQDVWDMLDEEDVG